MPSKKRATSRAVGKKSAAAPRRARHPLPHDRHELVIITGISGAGKLSALKAFEDLGSYAVDNLPAGLIANFADLVRDSAEIQRAALVVDIREGARVDKLPQLLQALRSSLKTTVLFLEASDDALLRRYQRDAPSASSLGHNISVKASIQHERDACSQSAKSRTWWSIPPSSMSTSCARLSPNASRAANVSRTR